MSRPPSGPRLARRPGRPFWYVAGCVNGRSFRISTGTVERAQAEKFLAGYLLEHGGSRSADPTVAEILNGYIKDRGPQIAGGENRLRWPAERVIDFFGSQPLTAITRASIRAYIAQRRKAGISDGTIRNETGCLQAALNHAVREGLIELAPHIQHPPQPAARQRWLTKAEAKRLIAACDGHLRLFVQIALNTTARPGAVLGLTWFQVDLERRLIEFNPAGRRQTAKRRAASPINDHLLGVLAQARADAVRAAEKREISVGTLPVIEWRGEPVRSIKVGFRLATAKAGLEDVTPHTLRHTAITWLVQAGIPLWPVGQLAGHSSPSTTAPYAKHDPEYLRHAVEALGRGMAAELRAAPGNLRLSGDTTGHHKKRKTQHNQGA